MNSLERFERVIVHKCLSNRSYAFVADPIEGQTVKWLRESVRRADKGARWEASLRAQERFELVSHSSLSSVLLCFSISAMAAAPSSPAEFRLTLCNFAEKTIEFVYMDSPRMG